MIEVNHVSRLFGTFRAVDDISFSIETGEIVGLLGPNGAGKTTTMRMITGFLEPSAGDIKVDGLDVVQNPVQTKRKIGYMPESAPLYADMIVADYLAYVAKMEGQDPSVKVPHLAEVCGLKEVMHKNIADLSRGNKQRVGLAHALMGDPEILILDEPTSGLDPIQVGEVRSLIKEIGRTRTVIVSTHILSEVEMLCSRVIIISGGKKVADSPTEQLREHYGNRSTIQLAVKGTSCESLEALLKETASGSSVKIQEQDGVLSASVGLSSEKEVRPEICRKIVEKGWDLLELSIAKNSLEDVFKIVTSAGGESNEQ